MILEAFESFGWILSEMKIDSQALCHQSIKKNKRIRRGNRNRERERTWCNLSRYSEGHFLRTFFSQNLGIDMISKKIKSIFQNILTKPHSRGFQNDYKSPELPPKDGTEVWLPDCSRLNLKVWSFDVTRFFQCVVRFEKTGFAHLTSMDLST